MPKGRRLCIEVGQMFGRLSVVGVEDQRTVGPRNVLCVCSCKEHCYVAPHSLVSGKTTSCGCRRRELLTTGPTTHGHTRGRRTSPEYRSWNSMLTRCRNRKCPAYPQYGGRGIRVSWAWELSFEAFLRDVGPRPGSGYSIERIDNDRGYVPGNVRWATAADQAHNRRSSKLTQQDVDRIREERKKGRLLDAIGQEFGVTKCTVSAIVHNKIWKDTNVGSRVEPNIQPGLPGVEE